MGLFSLLFFDNNPHDPTSVPGGNLKNNIKNTIDDIIGHKNMCVDLFGC